MWIESVQITCLVGRQIQGERESERARERERSKSTCDRNGEAPFSIISVSHQLTGEGSTLVEA